MPFACYKRVLSMYAWVIISCDRSKKKKINAGNENKLVGMVLWKFQSKFKANTAIATADAVNGSDVMQIFPGNIQG